MAVSFPRCGISGLSAHENAACFGAVHADEVDAFFKAIGSEGECVAVGVGRCHAEAGKVVYLSVDGRCVRHVYFPCVVACGRKDKLVLAVDSYIVYAGGKADGFLDAVEGVDFTGTPLYGLFMRSDVCVFFGGVADNGAHVFNCKVGIGLKPECNCTGCDRACHGSALF